MIETLWDTLPRQAFLPCEEQDYWDRQGPMQVLTDSRRRYHRFFMRGKALAYTDLGEFAIYLKDVSRMGIGFYSPEQLFPCDEIQLELPDRKHLVVKITRCIRLGEACFDCGSVFTTGASGFDTSQRS